MTATKPLLALCLLLAASRAACAADEDKKPAHQNVDVEKFEKLMKESDTVVLDVRTQKEYDEGHIKGATLIDFQSKDFEHKVKELDKSKTYLVHCASGIRSERACKKLDALEFPKTYNLEGGFRAWQKAGKPVEK
jgi:rhodanese-related sulfurtransferase